MRVLRHLMYGRILYPNMRHHYNTIIKIISTSKWTILDSDDFRSLGKQKQWHPVVWWMKDRHRFHLSGRHCLTRLIQSILQVSHRVTIFTVLIRLKRWWWLQLPRRWTCTRQPSSRWQIGLKPRTQSYCFPRRLSSPDRSLDYDSWTYSNRTCLQIKWSLLYRLNLNHSSFLTTRHPNKIIWSRQLQMLHQLLEKQLD